MFLIAILRAERKSAEQMQWVKFFITYSGNSEHWLIDAKISFFYSTTLYTTIQYDELVFERNRFGIWIWGYSFDYSEDVETQI